MTARKRILVLLALGLVLAIAGDLYLGANAPTPWEIQGGRLSDMNASLAVLDKGGPLLLADDVGPKVGGHRYRPLGIADDQGLYVYVPALAHALGTHDPLKALKWLYLGLFAITLLIYPLVFYELFRSWAAAVASGIAVLVCIRVLGYVDIYWISTWAVLTLLPVVLLLATRWPRQGLIVLVAVMLAASFATSIRSQAGLPIFLAGLLLVLFMRPWRWTRRGGAAVLLVVAYLSISPFGIGLVRDVRDNWAGIDLSAGKPGTHLFWHTAYIGLGFGPNAYAIKWNDSIAFAAAQREKPHVKFASGQYEATLRKLYFRLLRRDPGFVAATTLKKGAVELDHATALLLLLLLVVPAALLLAPDRRRLRRWGILVAPSLVVSFLPPLLAVPIPQYETGWFATVGLIAILALGWTVAWLTAAPVRSQLARLPGLARGSRAALGPVARTRAARLTAAAACLGLVVAIAAAVYGPRLQRQYDCWQALPPGGDAGSCALSHLANVENPPATLAAR